MKIRHGFVSNSSSSSFTINKHGLLSCQIAMIYEHTEFAKLLDIPTDEYSCTCGDLDSAWAVTEDNNTITVDTHMDNFEMEWFLANIVRLNMDKQILKSWHS